MPRAIRFGSNLVMGANPVKLADVAVAGVYQIGGNVEPVAWSFYSPPDRSGNSPVVSAATVHSMWIPEGAQVFAMTSALAMADTNISLWLLWPDNER